ncbi:MAG: hypothetical protein IJF48_01100 [Clostridia bacterium]|nr:hypothetical protein [Clostridia bacterium]
MKKLIILLLSLTLIISLAACNETDGGNDTTKDTSSETTEAPTDTTVNPPETTVPDTTASEVSLTYTLVFETGMTVTIGGPSEDFIASAGEPMDYMEAPSCIHEGYDKVYFYDWYSITTSPNANGEQYISEFSMLSDAVALKDSGLTVGSSAQAVEAVFGTDYDEQFGIRVYELDGATVSIQFVDGVISGFTVSAVTLN